MASDGRNTGKPEFDGFALSLDVKSDAEAQAPIQRAVGRRRGGDADGPDLLSPPASAWCADKFGVHWMVAQGEVERPFKLKWRNAWPRPLKRSQGVRPLARVRRPARSLVAMLHRSGAHEALVGPQGLHRHRLQDGSARRRHLSLRHADAQRRRHVGPVHLSRDRAAGKARLRQFVFRRERRRHPASRPRDLAAADAVDLHLRGRARRQDQVHRALANAQRHRRKSSRPSTPCTTA